MRFRTSLRYRIAIAFALTGAVVSLALAASLYWLTINVEERLVAQALEAELESFVERFRQTGQAGEVTSGELRIRRYTAPVSGAGPLSSEALPAGLNPRREGLQRVRRPDGGFYAMLRQVDGNWFLARFDDSGIRQREREYQAFLLGAVLVMTLLSAALGLWLAGRVLSPVRELGRRVRQLDPGGHPCELGRDFPDDEVGLLASAFDAYQQRLSAFIERERNFTGDVSHELRTPLAVIEGAAEVLQEDPGLDEARRRRVRRIARAAREMTEMTSALLELAREQHAGPHTGACDVAALLQDIIEGHRHLLERTSVRVELDIREHPHLPVQCALLRIVLANLIRNAFSYTREGKVCIRLDEAGVTVEDTGEGIPREQLEEVFRPFYSARGGEGIGLSLVRRICANYGWRVALDSALGRGSRFRLDFRS
ncbi:MAG TPA: HAMP domain-containing histidine kinase [Gammaproteobacteria bacterium]|nr:HAMP domain-containing histidine kinase [Gammaproteobacteria bacterium]